MNQYAIAFLVFAGALLAALGADLLKGVRDWYIIGGDLAVAGGVAIAGILTRLPQKEWTPEQRAEKLGRQ